MSQSRAFAQSTVVPAEAVADSVSVWHIITQDDNEYFGTIAERTEEYIRLATESLGEINIPIDQIKRIRMIDEDRIIDGEVWPENPQESRYFVTTSGHGLRKGQGYYQNAWIFFNQVAFGVSDYASLGLGLVPTFLFGADDVPLWITPKLSLPIGGKEGKVNVGVGALLGTIVGLDGFGFGVVYGTVTIGSRDQNVSIGVGQGLDGQEFDGSLVTNFGLMFRPGKRFYILVEGALADLADEVSGIILFGGRTVGKNLSFDFGLVAPVGEDGGGFALPWIAISIPFGG